MSLFDPNASPREEITPEVITAVNGIIDRLRAMKVDSISVAGELRTPNLIRCYIQAQIRRSLTYIEAGYTEFYAGRSLVTNVCARANYENVAAFFDFSNSLISLLKADDHAAVLKFLEVKTFATRIPSFLEEHGKEICAVNVVTQVKKMNKIYPNFEKSYDHLSDSAHPNAMGAFVHFVSFDPALPVAIFHDSGKNADWAMAELIMSGLLLTYMEASINDIEQHLGNLPPSLKSSHG
jgi:hypothetical protein